MNSQSKPRARQQKLLVREMASGETIVYDREGHEAHCLNRTSGMVWARCDGRSTVSEIAAAVTMELDEAFGEELVEVALAELDEAGLLEVGLEEGAGGLVFTRRQAMGRLGKGVLIAALVPVITTILAPTPAAAGSCRPATAECTSGFQCCSGFCKNGFCQ